MQSLSSWVAGINNLAEASVIEARLVHDLALRGQTVATVRKQCTPGQRNLLRLTAKNESRTSDRRPAPSYAVSGHSGWSHAHAISTSSFPASLQMSPQ
jgi:hypothetical protein